MFNRTAILHDGDVIRIGFDPCTFKVELNSELVASDVNEIPLSISTPSTPGKERKRKGFRRERIDILNKTPSFGASTFSTPKGSESKSRTIHYGETTTASSNNRSPQEVLEFLENRVTSLENTATHAENLKLRKSVSVDQMSVAHQQRQLQQEKNRMMKMMEKRNEDLRKKERDVYFSIVSSIHFLSKMNYNSIAAVNVELKKYQRKKNQQVEDPVIEEVEGNEMEGNSNDEPKMLRILRSIKSIEEKSSKALKFLKYEKMNVCHKNHDYEKELESELAEIRTKLWKFESKNIVDQLKTEKVQEKLRLHEIDKEKREEGLLKTIEKMKLKERETERQMLQMKEEMKKMESNFANREKQRDEQMNSMKKENIELQEILKSKQANLKLIKKSLLSQFSSSQSHRDQLERSNSDLLLQLEEANSIRDRLVEENPNLSGKLRESVNLNRVKSQSLLADHEKVLDPNEQVSATKKEIDDYFRKLKDRKKLSASGRARRYLNFSKFVGAEDNEKDEEDDEEEKELESQQAEVKDGRYELMFSPEEKKTKGKKKKKLEFEVVEAPKRKKTVRVINLKGERENVMGKKNRSRKYRLDVGKYKKIRDPRKNVRRVISRKMKNKVINYVEGGLSDSSMTSFSSNSSKDSW